MNFRNISSWCIRNPVAPIVLFVGLMLAGLVAFARMQVNNAPDIDFPAAIVSVSQPGAAPNELETQVTQRVESAIRGITGVDDTIARLKAYEAAGVDMLFMAGVKSRADACRRASTLPTWAQSSASGAR